MDSDTFYSQFRQSNLLYTEESLLRYRSGGYHPVNLRDTFKEGRYLIRHKLGWGRSSTVWLADDRASVSQRRWVALKIKTAKPQLSREAENIERLAEKQSSIYIVQLLDSFTHRGPNGDHQCLVFELLGPSVSRLLITKEDKEGYDQKFRPETVFRMSTQLLKAVKFIHSAGMCHGDIDDANVAFTCSRSSNLGRKKLLKVIGRPHIERLSRIDRKPLENGLPTHLVETAQWVNWTDEDKEEIRLLDFGDAFLQGEESEKLPRLGPLKAPEIIFTNQFDYRVELWLTGCLIYCFLFGTYPFFHLPSLGGDTFLVCQMIYFVEGLPDGWKSQWESMKMRSNCPLEVNEKYSQVSGLQCDVADCVHSPGLEPVIQVIEGLMRFLPSNRISLDEALNLLNGGLGDKNTNTL